MSEQEGSSPITATVALEGRRTDHDIKGLESWKGYTDILSERPLSWPPKKNPFTTILHMLNDANPGGIHDHAVNNIYHGMSKELQADKSTQEFVSIFFDPDMQTLFTTPLMMNQFNWKIAGGANDSWALPLDNAANYYYDQITGNETSTASLIAYLRVLMMKSLIKSGWRQGKEVTQQQTQSESDIQKQIDTLLETPSISSKLGEKIDIIKKLRTHTHAWAAAQSEVFTYCENKRPSYFGQTEAYAAATQTMGKSITTEPMATQGTPIGPPDWKSIFDKTQQFYKRLPQVTIT